ncbi:MAG: HEAT repeat domain-containing protein [Planctomycetes bacterium]|nr:HEAT repeat domain-containing protein [Planctomycetota bacterium]
MYKLRLTLLLLINIAFATVILADVDVSVPPGSGLDWDKGMLKPITTDHGRIQSVVTSGGKHDASSKTFEAGVQIEIPIQNLYGYFNIQTPDIAGEVIRVSETTPGVRDRILTKGPSNNFEYPPTYPTELVWDGVSTVIRVMLHPEVVNEHEAVLHFLELGSAGLLGGQMVFSNNIASSSKSMNKFFSSEVKKMIGVLPIKPPTLPSKRGYKGMMERLAVVEAVGGFPGSLDPQYARKLLSIGKDAIPGLLNASKTTHQFLLRNVSYLLGAYKTPQVQKRLAELVYHKDKVVSVRAARALITQGGSIPSEIVGKLLKDRDPLMRILGIYGVGKIRSKHLLSNVYKMLRAINPKDYYGKAVTWSALEAIARVGTDDKKIVKYLHTLKKSYEKNLPKNDNPSYDKSCRWQPRFPESEGHMYKVFYEKVMLALAACGDKDSINEALNVAILDIDPVNHFLYVDVLANLGDEGVFVLKKLIAEPPMPKQVRGKTRAFVQTITLSTFVQSAALKAISKQVKSTFLQQIVYDKKNHSMMSIALTLLYQANRGRAKMLCAEIEDDIDLAGGSTIDIEKLLAEKAIYFKEYTESIAKWRTEKDPVKKDKYHKEYLAGMRKHSAIEAKLKSFSTDNSIFAKQFFAATVLDIGSRSGAISFEFIEKAATVAFEQSAFTHRIGSNYLKEIPKVYMVPAFMECASVALGRSGDYRAIPLLTKILDADLPSGSAEAALALANFKSRTSYVALLKALDSENGWTRFAASQALKRLSGEGVEIDWIFGSAGEIRSGKEKFKKLIIKKLKTNK